ncbi:TolC family outer membrane protein [Oceanibacterium hippocampi]|uniref:Outer membrane efflux protein BepC n=1 Tax=Oceanibacterium hippocampi TaxID=745714 RepID=A0A1Y5S077_9PROT|nr:TolC family outer membrane protein [Oceanibacterium hippocampi]SLN28222.1 Outer membrane efflux protein BepC precursor [Oceanibacterium hippocampi]
MHSLKSLSTSIAVVALAGPLAVGLFTGAAGAASLKETVQAAIGTYPEISEAAYNRYATERELDQARGLYLPSVDLQAGYGPEWTDDQSFDNKWLTRKESRITIRETIFDGYGREAEVERQQARTDAAAHRVRERTEAIGLDVVQVYLNVLRNREIIRLAEENVEAHNATLGTVRDRFDGGQGGIGDVQQAESRLSAANAALIQAQRDLDEAEIIFRRLVQQVPADLEEPAAPVAALPPDPDAAVERAQTESPDIQLAVADVDTSRAELRASKAGFYPSLNVEVSGSMNEDIDGVEGHDADFQALLVMRYNLFRGFIDRNRQREAAARLSQTQARLNRLRLEVAEETRQSWSAYQRALARVEVLDGQTLSNSQVLSTYRQEFDIGQRDLLDLLDSENELFQSRTRHVTSRYAALFAQFRLLASMGVLMDALGVEVPQSTVANARSSTWSLPD